MRQGIIGGSFKPLHQGHFELIKMASRENDKVIIFASTTDRIGEKDEAKVFGEDMKYIWETYIIPMLPINVSVIFSSSPIREIYKYIGEANVSNSPFIYSIYADNHDIDDYYPEFVRNKYFDKIYKNGRVIFLPILRSSTCEISGSDLRKMIYYGMKDELISFLPEELDREIIWKILHTRYTKERKPTEEEITRSFFGHSG